MKEATGELNMTVITVVAIAAVGAFFYAVVWPAVKDNIMKSTRCADKYACTAEGNCKYDVLNADGTIEKTINIVCREK